MKDDSRLIELARAEALAVEPVEPVALPGGLSGYRVLAEVHRGTQGVVYEAIQESTGQTVAIKVMRRGPHASESDRFRFEREARILGRLRHPNIVSIHDTGRSSDDTWFVMDFIDGQPLDAWARASERPLRELLALFVRICDAVAAAHVRGVIHRDLKPGNIRVDERGEPHVLDFGLAKVDDELQPGAMMTMTGQFVGSLPWSAPEQAAGDSGAVDVRTDVYALGVILYQLVCRRFPYAVTGNLRDILDNIQTSEPVRPRSVRPDVDDELETILLTCLAKEKERRYQSAADLQHDLQAYLDGDPIHAKRDSGWYLFRKSLSRHRWAVGVAASMLLLVTAGFLTCLAFWQRAERHRADAETARHEAETARASAEREAEERRRVASFFDGMFDSMNPFPLVTLVVGDDGTVGDPAALELLLDRAKERVRTDFGDAPHLAAEVSETLGKGFLGLRRYDDAADELRYTLDVRRSRLGDDHPDTLDAALWLGEAVVCSGDVDQAETILAPAVMRMERLYGPDDAPTLRAQQALGFALASQGHLDEGVDAIVAAHARSREQLGADAELTLTSAPLAAYWLAARGETDESVRIARRASVEARRELGEMHVITHLTENALLRVISEGRALRDAADGEFAPGGPTIDTRIELFVDHEAEGGATGDRANAPGVFFTARGDGVDLREPRPGGSWMGVLVLPTGELTAMWRRAETFLSEGQRVAGMALARAVLDGLDDHPDEAATLSVRVRARLGQELASEPSTLVEGERMLRRAWSEALGNQGPSGVETLVCQQELAVAVHHLGRTAEAAALLDGVLDAARAALPASDARLASLQWTQADALRRVGRASEARDVLADAVDALADSLGDDDPTTRAARAALEAWDARS